MTPEAQRIAIAEACPKLFRVLNGTSHYRYGCEGEESEVDPLSDLNAMNEAEKVMITTEQQNKYQSEIAEVCWRDQDRATNQVVFNQLTATAAQRAEAFLKVMRLWKE